MSNSNRRNLRQSFWELLNIKIRVGSLQIDVYLDSSFVPNQVDEHLASHSHSMFELHTILSGTGTLVMGDRETEMKPGTIHLFGPNVFHAFRASKERSYVRSAMRFSYQQSPNTFSWFPEHEELQFLTAFSDVTYRHFHNVEHNRKIMRLMEEIRSEIQTSSACAYTNVQGLFLQLFVQLVRLLLADRSAADSTVFPERVKDEIRHRVIEQYFLNCHENLTIEQLADRLNLSPKQTSRILKQKYKMSFNEMLVQIRIELAKQLLETSNLPIVQISKRVGYRTVPYFCDLFLEKTGMTPEQYRSQSEKSIANGLLTNETSFS
jgi:AraC-like DNA-binding protein